MPFDDDNDDLSHLPTVDSAHHDGDKALWKKLRPGEDRVRVAASMRPPPPLPASDLPKAPEPEPEEPHHENPRLLLEEHHHVEPEPHWHEEPPAPPPRKDAEGQTRLVIRRERHEPAPEARPTRVVVSPARQRAPAAALTPVDEDHAHRHAQDHAPEHEEPGHHEIEDIVPKPPPLRHAAAHRFDTDEDSDDHARHEKEESHASEAERKDEPHAEPVGDGHLLAVAMSEASAPHAADNSGEIQSARRRAWITAAVVHLGIFLLLAILHVVPMDFTLPEIVAITDSDLPENVDWKKVTQSTPQTSAMASISPITSTGTSDIAMPSVDFTSTANELNVGSSFGAFGAGAGMGGKVSFLGNTGRGRHVVFVVDVSGSMSSIGRPKKGEPISRFDLLKKELIRSLSTMPLGTQYQILFFSDFAWPHNSLRAGDLTAFEKYKWDIQPNNTNVTIPRFSYLSASTSTLNDSKRIIERADNPGGTNWGSGLLMALRATPAPDVIFFMTDGNESDEMGWVDIVTRANTAKRTTIHTTAMMEPSGAEPLARLAALNRGKFTIVMPDGEIVKGDDFFARMRQ